MALELTTDKTIYTSVLGDQDYMYADDSVLVAPSALITDFSAQGTPSLTDPGTYDFELPLTFPDDSTIPVTT